MNSDVLMTGAGHERGNRRHPRVGTLAWLLSVLVAAMLIGGAASAFIGLREDVDGLTALADAEQEQADSRDADIAALRHQLESVGIEPAAGDPSTTVSDGEDGEDGRDGRDGLTVIGPTGASGSDGAPGADGKDGADGADGSTGEQGPTGPQGPPGQSVMGPQGQPGEDGTTPSLFVFVAAGVTYTCSDLNGDGVFECTQEAG